MEKVKFDPQKLFAVGTGTGEAREILFGGATQRGQAAYLKALEALDPELVKALLEGDWDAIEEKKD